MKIFKSSTSLLVLGFGNVRNRPLSRLVETRNVVNEHVPPARFFIYKIGIGLGILLQWNVSQRFRVAGAIVPLTLCASVSSSFIPRAGPASSSPRPANFDPVLPFSCFLLLSLVHGMIPTGPFGDATVDTRNHGSRYCTRGRRPQLGRFFKRSIERLTWTSRLHHHLSPHQHHGNCHHGVTVGPGAFTRSMDTLENFYKLLGDSSSKLNREHWALTTSFRLAFPTSVADPLPYLKRTWLAIRQLHPGIGSTAPPTDPANPTSKVALTVPPLDPEAWLAKTFVVHDDSTLVDDATAALSLRPTDTATLHWVPATGTIVFRSSHWRIDGVGSIMLAHAFMATLVSVLRLGLDAELSAHASSVANGSLTPSLDDVVKAPLDEESTPEHLKKAADSLIATFLGGIPTIGLPTTPGSENAIPGPTGRAHVSLDPATTAAVLTACSARGFTVTSAVHAALIRVVTRYPQHPVAKNYAAFVATDMRRRLGAPWDGVPYAVGIFSSGVPVCIEGALEGKSFDALAADFHAVYSQDLDRLGVDERGEPFGMQDIIGPYIRRTTKLFTAPVPENMPPIQNPDLSSLGLVEKILKREYVYGDGDAYGPGTTIEVTDFWIGVEMLARALQCHVWTFRDSLTLHGCFNTSFYERDFVAGVLGQVTAELLVGLGLVAFAFWAAYVKSMVPVTTDADYLATSAARQGTRVGFATPTTKD
ncbi:hypothetical protein ACRALDRAFT_212804 [Sodiomyces alcalophilus JCM 7366]|uniref:uncharacterized protein n=1 Tax=Sodiomyces alcalophilus JCM 7366 TaxID=591952 RepID=UPI0039B5B72B